MQIYMTCEQKRKIFDWLFNGKTFIVLYTADQLMCLLYRGNYVACRDLGRLYIKEPGIIKFMSHHFRHNGMTNIFITNNLYDADVMKAYWIDEMMKHSNNGYDVMLGDRILIPAHCETETLMINADLYERIDK